MWRPMRVVPQALAALASSSPYERDCRAQAKTSPLPSVGAGSSQPLQKAASSLHPATTPFRGRLQGLPLSLPWLLALEASSTCKGNWVTHARQPPLEGDCPAKAKASLLSSSTFKGQQAACTRSPCKGDCWTQSKASPLLFTGPGSFQRLQRKVGDWRQATPFLRGTVGASQGLPASLSGCSEDLSTYTGWHDWGESIKNCFFPLIISCGTLSS